jgi:hypothetical protein
MRVPRDGTQITGLLYLRRTMTSQIHADKSVHQTWKRRVDDNMKETGESDRGIRSNGLRACCAKSQ